MVGWWKVGRASRYGERHLLRLGGRREEVGNQIGEDLYTHTHTHTHTHTLEGNCMCNYVSVLLPSLVCNYHWTNIRSYLLLYFPQNLAEGPL